MIGGPLSEEEEDREPRQANNREHHDGQHRILLFVLVGVHFTVHGTVIDGLLLGVVHGVASCGIKFQHAALAHVPKTGRRDLTLKMNIGGDVSSLPRHPLFANWRTY
jgi:hypothetical protein